MRYLVVTLGMLLLPASALAANDYIAEFCSDYIDPTRCATTVLANKPYAEAQQLAKELLEQHKATRDRIRETGEYLRQAPPAKTSATSPSQEYCLTTRHPEDCIAALQMDLRERQQEDQFDQRHREQFDRQQLEMQQRQIDAQLEQARVQANGMALFGAGQALINGMTQGFNQMRLPMPTTPALTPIPLNPVHSPIRCFSSTPGAMQSTTCY